MNYEIRTENFEARPYIDTKMENKMEKRTKLQCDITIESKKVAKTKAKLMGVPIGKFIEGLIMNDNPSLKQGGAVTEKEISTIVKHILSEVRKSYPWYKRIFS
jgi:hypothetical protein